MDLLTLLEPWANPEFCVKLYHAKEYEKAVLLIAEGSATWNNVSRKLDP